MAEIQERWPEATFDLARSGGGVFEVTVDGDLVFSKRSLGRHANPGEVVSLIAQRRGA